MIEAVVMGTVVGLAVGQIMLATTSNEMTRSTKSTDICLILFFLVVTMKNKQVWQTKREGGKKTCIVHILQKACSLG